jgi:hypothetical protein
MSFEQDPYEREEEEIRKAFAEKDAEIERLRDALKQNADAQATFQEIVRNQRKLIGELAEAVRAWKPYLWKWRSQLLKRARETREKT